MNAQRGEIAAKLDTHMYANKVEAAVQSNDKLIGVDALLVPFIGSKSAKTSKKNDKRIAYVVMGKQVSSYSS